MDNINQPENKKSILKPILLIVLGIVIGIGATLPFLFIFDGDGSEKEVIQAFNKDLQEKFPKVFEEDLEDVSVTEEKDGNMAVMVITDLTVDQFYNAYGTEPEAEELQVFMLVITAEYTKEKGEWVLDGRIKTYASFDYEFVKNAVSSSQGKAQDAAIKAELSGMRASAEFHAMENNDSYKGFCNSENAQSVIEAIRGYNKQIMCDDNDDEWATFASLNNEDEKCFCVDFKGTAKSLNNMCPPVAVTKCP